MTSEERKDEINQRVEAAIIKLRKIRRTVVGNGHIKEDDFQDLNEIISSLRHNVEMFNGNQ